MDKCGQIINSISINNQNKKDGDEQQAVSVLISNCFNQTIGRNTGYRNSSESKHLAIIPIGLAPLIKSDVVTQYHDIKIELIEEPVDVEFIARLVALKMDEEKQLTNQDIIKGNKPFFRKKFIKPVVEQWNSNNKQKFKPNDVVKCLFAELITSKRQRIDGKQIEWFCY